MRFPPWLWRTGRGSGHPIPVVERRVSAWVILPDVTDSLDSVSGQNFREQPVVLQSVQGPKLTCGHQLWVKTQQDKSHHLPHRVARFNLRMRSSKGALSGAPGREVDKERRVWNNTPSLRDGANKQTTAAHQNPDLVTMATRFTRSQPPELQQQQI